MKPIVTNEWLYHNLNDPNLIILDASERENKSNLKTDHPNLQLPGARFFDTKNVFRDKNNPIPNMIPSAEVFEEGCQRLGINKKSKIVIYDNLGVYNSPRVWWMFKIMGHNSVSVLDGGLPHWIRSGYETQSCLSTDYPLGDFQSDYQPERVKQHHQVSTNLSRKDFKVIDARSNGRFHGTTPEPREDLKGGHIPNSLNLPFNEVLKDGKFLPQKELSSVIAKLNIEDELLVFTCGSGITACIILLALEIIKTNPKSLYDGSWSEWGQLDGVSINQ